jgi:hypothetical protein
VGNRVDLVVDPLRGERISIELPLTFRTPPETARRELGLPDWLDLTDPIVARAVVLLRAAHVAEPSVHLAMLGGVANRLRCRASNVADLGLRRGLHDLDVACRHKEIRSVRAFLESLHEREGSALQFVETQGDRIFNASGEGRRLRYHMVLGQDASTSVALGTVDLLADEFRFCHRFDLREEVRRAPEQHGTLSPALLLLAKLQFIQRIPDEDRDKVRERVLGPYGRHELVIGPEAKDVRDIVALLVEHRVEEGTEGISPQRVGELLAHDWGLWRTVSLNLEMVGRSAILAAVPSPDQERARAGLDQVAAVAKRAAPTRRFGFLGGQWWEEVDATPVVDGTGTVASRA